MNYIKLLPIAAAALATSGYARADAPIAYSARYYSPPTAKQRSHFHIYTIDASGKSKRQLTTGEADDCDPQWSPDGRSIAFLRTYDNVTPGTIMVVDSRGHNLRKIVNTDSSDDTFTWKSSLISLNHGADNSTIFNSLYSAKGSFVGFDHHLPPTYNQSPNGKYEYDIDDTSSTGKIVEVASQKVVGHTKVAYSPFLWLNNLEVLGIRTLPISPTDSNGGNATYEVCQFGLHGDTVSSTELRQQNISSVSSNPYSQLGSDFFDLTAWPGKSGVYLAWQNWHNSTGGEDYGLFYLEPFKGALRFICESKFVAWSPNNVTFCASPSRRTSNYERRKDGTFKLVWTSPLEVVDTSSGTIKDIQTGLLLVQNASWKHD